jgi:hypothetical protein
MGYAVSGATTYAANLAQATNGGGAVQMIYSVTGKAFQMSATFYLTTLTAGSNTFTAQYASTIGNATCTFTNRNIVVMLP